MSFLRPAWRKLVKTNAGTDRRSLWSRSHDGGRANDCNRATFGSKAAGLFAPSMTFCCLAMLWRISLERQQVGLAVADHFEDWRDDKTKRLEVRLREVDTLAAAGELAEASLTTEGLSISPIRKSENEAADAIIRRLYGMLPRLRVPTR